MPGFGRVFASGALGLTAACSPASSAVTFERATIGNLGNSPDVLTSFGTVEYTYRIATTEVTKVQYAEFLHAVAASDPKLLYISRMGINESTGNVRPEFECWARPTTTTPRTLPT
jgi:hypothetical protein